MNTYSYYGYGLTIQSEIELPGFGAGGASPDLTIRFAPFVDTSPNQRNRLAELLGDRHVVGGVIEPDLKFWVIDGSEIVLDSASVFEERAVSTYVSGLIISAALRQRGRLVLHGSCVARDGRGIAFIGDSGLGKSSLASYFHANGYDVLCDDVLACVVPESGKEGVLVHRGGTALRLRPEAGEWLRPDFQNLPTLMTGSHKKVQLVPTNREQEPVVLEAIYVLSPFGRAENRVEPLPTLSATMSLIRHTRVHNLFNTDSDRALNLQQCSQVARQVKVRHLVRKKGVDQLPAIADLILEDIGARAVTA